MARHSTRSSGSHSRDYLACLFRWIPRECSTSIRVTETAAGQLGQELPDARGLDLEYPLLRCRWCKWCVTPLQRVETCRGNPSCTRGKKRLVHGCAQDVPAEDSCHRALHYLRPGHRQEQEDSQGEYIVTAVKYPGLPSARAHRPTLTTRGSSFAALKPASPCGRHGNVPLGWVFAHLALSSPRSRRRRAGATSLIGPPVSSRGHARAAADKKMRPTLSSLKTPPSLPRAVFS